MVFGLSYLGKRAGHFVFHMIFCVVCKSENLFMLIKFTFVWLIGAQTTWQDVRNQFKVFILFEFGDSMNWMYVRV